MLPKLRSQQLMTEEDLKKLMDSDCKLLSSKQLAKVLGVTEGAIRKQRSMNKSFFQYAKLGNRVWYPVDLMVKTVHEHVVTKE